MSTEWLIETTRLQLSRGKSLVPGSQDRLWLCKAAAPAVVWLRCQGVPQGRRAWATPLFSQVFALWFCFCCLFLHLLLPQRNSAPLLSRDTSGHSKRLLKASLGCFTGTTIQQPSISRVFVYTLGLGNIQEMQDYYVDPQSDFQAYNRKKSNILQLKISES